MSSLSELPELVGFFGYSREDDDDSRGALSARRDRIQRELRGQLGRSMKTPTLSSLRLWQDSEAIAAGQLWQAEIRTAIAQSVFFIPIITPTAVRSDYCKFELESFLARETALDRNELVFPILYIRVPVLKDYARRKNDPLLLIIAERQYLDWRALRHHEVDSTDVRKAIERFCTQIADALNRPWLTPEERQKQEEAEARQRQRDAEEAQARQREVDTQVSLGVVATAVPASPEQE
jgi:TIR domain